MESLFRKEVLSHQNKRLYGEVIRINSIKTWTLVGGFLAIALVVIVSLSVGQFARKETVSGTIVSSKGLSTTTLSSGSIIDKVHVNLGQKVDKGDLLLTLSSREKRTDGTERSLVLLQELQREEALLLGDIETFKNRHKLQNEFYQLRQARIRQSLLKLNKLIKIEKNRVLLTTQAFETSQPLFAKGLISKIELQEREQSLLKRRSDLIQLELQSSDLEANLEALQKKMEINEADHKTGLSDLHIRKSQVKQRIVENESSQAITAEVRGTIVMLMAKVGQQIQGDEPLVILLPESAELLAELYVPNSAVGFIRSGQRVRLALDAFPFQKFGTQKATVSEIFEAPILQYSNSNQRNFYVVRALIDDAESNSEVSLRLRTGMTLSADIILEDRTALEFIFEPIISAFKRNG